MDDARRIPYKLFRGSKVPLNADDALLDAAVSYEPRNGNLFIISYPKSGTTWVQHIVYLIMNDGRPTTDITEILKKIPFPEQDGFPDNDGHNHLAVKYHLPFRLVPRSETAKYIVVVRNPMDCCVSYYHFLNNLPNYDIESFDEFFEAFITGELPYGDFFEFVLPWYHNRHRKNVLFLTYENMKRNHIKAVCDMAVFLGKESVIQEERLIRDIVHYSSIDYMKAIIDGTNIMESYLKVHNSENRRTDRDESVRNVLSMNAQNKKNPVMIRKGCVGDWKNHLNGQQEQRMKLKILEKLGHTELREMWYNL